MGSKMDMGPPPSRKNYGPFVRIAEPDRHIYQTTIDYRRWMFGLAALCGFVLFGWGARQAWPDGTDLFFEIFSVFIGMAALSALVLAFMVFAFRTRLEIGPGKITLLKRGFFGRTILRTWAHDDIERVAVKTMPTFHIGGSTPIYPIVIVLADGDEQQLSATFDDLGPAERFIRDIAESVQSMATRAEAW
jgi:hypothetical protein